MKYGNTEIEKLTDDELKLAIHAVVDIDKFRLDQIDNKRDRHKVIFKNHPPIENANFTRLVEELNSEFKKRGIKNLSLKETW